MCILGKKVFITSTCGGFINRNNWEEEGYSFEGVLKEIDFNKENPFQISFNNGVSLINLKRDDFVLIEDYSCVEEIKENIRYVLVNIDKTELIDLNYNAKGKLKINFIKNNFLNFKKTKIFSCKKNAEDYLKKLELNDYSKILKIESYCIK